MSVFWTRPWDVHPVTASISNEDWDMLKSTFPHWSVGVVWPDGAIGITKVSRLHGEGVQKFCQSTGTPVQVFHRELFAEYTRKQFKALNLGADIPRKRRSRSDQVRTPQGA